MDFGSATNKAKAWKDIWGAGQGVGTMKDIPSVKDLIDRLSIEYDSTLNELTN
jgi:Dioxygenases related to 2-nitropropane dioxygenase